MDLEELKEDLQIQLTEIQNQIAELKSVSKNSTNSQTDSLIFSELRKLLKEQNEQGEKNLNKNADELSRNARSVYSELSSNANSKLNELNESVKKTQGEIQNQITAIADGVGKDISKKLNLSVSEVLTAAQNLRIKSRKNIFYSAGLTLLLLLVAVGGILFVWKWHDGTKIAEMRIEKMLESERADIQKKAVEDYRNSYQFREDACREVSENISKLDTLHYLNKYIKSSTVSEYPALKSFYKDFIKSGDEQYKKSNK